MNAILGRSKWAIRAQISAVGDDEVEVVMSTAALARDGHILVPQGCILDNYRANPIVLWSHDPDHPVANAENVVVGPQQLSARVRFAPLGAARKADEIRALVKSGVIRAVSVGFDPVEMEPLDPKQLRGGQRITAWELLELSFVSVPADPGAMVTARANGDTNMADWKVGAAKGLPIEDNDSWDGPAAEQAIFAWAAKDAGADEFDPAKARQGFLVYDAAAPGERGSYKLPIAHVVDGELKVPKGAIRAAASRLPDTDIPDAVKTAAGEVLDAYKKAAGMDAERGFSAPRRGRRLGAKRRAGGGLARQGKIVFQRGLYEVAELCWLLESLGWQVDIAKWETAIEGDASKVPAMLASVYADLADALLAMTAEEIAEALANRDVEPEADEDDDILVVEERAHIAAAASPAVRQFRRGLAHAKLRSGKTLSADTVEVLRAAKAKHEDAIELCRSAIRTHKQGLAAVDDLMDRSDGSDDPDADNEDVQTSDGDADSAGSENGRAARPAARRAPAGAPTETHSADFRRRLAALRLRAARV